MKKTLFGRKRSVIFCGVFKQKNVPVGGKNVFRKSGFLTDMLFIELSNMRNVRWRNEIRKRQDFPKPLEVEFSRFLCPTQLNTFA